MSGVQAVIISWPLSSSTTDVHEFLYKTPLRFAEVTSIDYLLEQLMWDNLSGIEYGEPLAAGKYMPLARIRVGQTPKGIALSASETVVHE